MSDLQSLHSRVEQNPGNDLFRFSYAKALFDSKSYAEAEEHLTLCLKKKPDWMVVAILLAKCSQLRENLPLARRRYEQALELAVAQKHEGPEAEIRNALNELE